MAVEIERKFLVQKEALPDLGPGTLVDQGYLGRRPAIRVRVMSTPKLESHWVKEAFLTIKGKGTVTRSEFEFGIPVEDAEQLLDMCAISLTKIRHYVTFGDYTWEVDEFTGAHQGLWLAEVELPTEDASFERPAWIGHEVTEDPRYSNVSLAEMGRAP